MTVQPPDVEGRLGDRLYSAQATWATVAMRTAQPKLRR
jgi:hypothetical protein